MAICSEMARFRQLRGSQSVSNFFRNTTDLKTLQKKKGARLETKTRFSHTRFQNLSRRFWAFSNKAKLQRDISRAESRKTWKSRLGERKIEFSFVFGNFTQKNFFEPACRGKQTEYVFYRPSRVWTVLYRCRPHPVRRVYHLFWFEPKERETNPEQCFLCNVKNVKNV